ncbi:MAG: hypothetical protein OQL09_01735 [Gammaproteobacteria bacterium]|nr:hypothetical protein [Gammaproteobacteria bacterium]
MGVLQFICFFKIRVKSVFLSKFQPDNISVWLCLYSGCAIKIPQHIVVLEVVVGFYFCFWPETLMAGGLRVVNIFSAINDSCFSRIFSARIDQQYDWAGDSKTSPVITKDEHDKKK